MTLKPTTLEETRGCWFVPQAIINRPVTEIARSLNTDLLRGHDDLDAFEGVFALLNGTPVALKHYRGHPPGTVTIYLPGEIETISRISSLIEVILNDLDLSQGDLRWQRRDWEGAESD